jgi:hypothetical protein
MSKTMDWDKFGHCVMCHKNMLVKQIVGQKEIMRFTPEYTEGEFLLDDGSKMNVALCKSCKENMTEKDEEKIMDCVIRGWEQEIKECDWTPEKQKDYMDRYSKLKIVCNSENKPKDVLENKLKAHKEKQHGVGH